jgi:hypothetical protein
VNIFDWVKLAPRYFLPIAIATGLSILNPFNFMEQLGILQFIDQNKTYISIIFLLSSAFVLTDFFYTIFKWFQKRASLGQKQKVLHKGLQKLSIREKEVLIQYIASREKTLNFSTRNTTVIGLENQKILSRASTGDILFWPFTIHPKVWEYLNDHPEVLDERKK